MRAVVLAVVILTLWLAANGKLIALWDTVVRAGAGSSK